MIWTTKVITIMNISVIILRKYGRFGHIHLIILLGCNVNIPVHESQGTQESLIVY